MQNIHIILKTNTKPNLDYSHMWWHRPVKRKRQNQVFKVILREVANLRPAWTVQPCLKTITKKKQPENKPGGGSSSTHV